MGDQFGAQLGLGLVIVYLSLLVKPVYNVTTHKYFHFVNLNFKRMLTTEMAILDNQIKILGYLNTIVEYQTELLSQSRGEDISVVAKEMGERIQGSVMEYAERHIELFRNDPPRKVHCELLLKKVRNGQI